MKADSPIAEAQPGRFATVAKYLGRYRWYLVVGALAVIGSNGLMLINPYLTKLIIDLLKNHAPMSQVGLLVLAMLGLAVASGVCRFTIRRTLIWMSRHLEYDLRSELVVHLLKLSPSFYDRTRVGDIMARATNDLEAVRMMIGPAVMHIANTIVVGVGALIMMAYLSPRLTLYALVPALFLPIVMNRVGNMIHRRFVKIQEHFSHMTAVVQENLAGVRVVRAYRQEEKENDNFDKLSQKYLTLNLDLGKVHALFYPLFQLIATALMLVILYFGGRAVIGGDLELSTVVAFFLYLGMLTWPLIAIGWVVSLYQRGTVSLDRINSILNTEPEIRSTGDKLHTAHLRGKLEFRHLTFAYDGKPVLRDIELMVEPGQTLGIVGLTGSGKTTLVSLLARLYQVERGQLFIDDVDINDWDTAALRQQIGFASQEPFLFSATIDENIRFGCDTADRPAVERMAQLSALAKDVTEFPLGYDTMVGERGITLSGGQKQRAAIARAVMIEPAILILDDVTSSVDTETEHEINVRIHAHTSRLTTLIVSHRVSSVKDADLILFMENGQIVERGNHEHLITLGGRYADLYHSQVLAEELESL
ncbi:MAG: ABC transporter ATP-binding protein [candidate division Zixibacteria bacterium]|nr:ABC transporter ATP-binding protein [candidate division Zixibacteria bacterium]